MITEDAIKQKIKEYADSKKHILEQTPKDVLINAYVAMEQCASTAYLDALYMVLGERRPHMRCDDFKDMNR